MPYHIPFSNNQHITQHVSPIVWLCYVLSLGEKCRLSFGLIVISSYCKHSFNNTEFILKNVRKVCSQQGILTYWFRITYRSKISQKCHLLVHLYIFSFNTFVMFIPSCISNILISLCTTIRRSLSNTVPICLCNIL